MLKHLLIMFLHRVNRIYFFRFFVNTKICYMYKFILLFLIVSFSSFSQETITIELDSVLNLDQAEMYLAENPSKQNKIVVFNKEKHKTVLANDLFERGKAKTENDFEITHYKVVDKDLKLHYRVSYIYLDGKKLNDAELQATKSLITNKYNEGYPFNKLAKQYSMNFSARSGGDSGWLTRGTMHPQFEDMAITNTMSIGDLYSIDIENKQKHYIVLKTYDIRYIKEVKALKIVEKKD